MSRTDILEQFKWTHFSFLQIAHGVVNLKADKRIWRKPPRWTATRVHPRVRAQGWGGVCVYGNACWLELSHACQMLLGFAGCGECRSDQYELFFWARGTFLHMTFTVLYACVYVCVCGCRQDRVVRKRFRNTPIKITLTITRHIASIPQQVRAFSPVVLRTDFSTKTNKTVFYKCKYLEKLKRL